MSRPPYQLATEPGLTLSDLHGAGMFVTPQVAFEDPAMRNLRNAGWGAAAVMAGAPDKDNEPQTLVTDMLANVRHACDVLGVDYDEAQRLADVHYQAEISTKE